MLKLTSSPDAVGTLVAANRPPTLLVVLSVNRSFPDPTASVAAVQLLGTTVVFPAAVRQATLVLGVVGSTTAPSPLAVALWKGWLNSTVEAAYAAVGINRPIPAASTLPASRPATTRRRGDIAMSYSLGEG